MPRPETINLCEVLATLWPDTDLKWMVPTVRVCLIGRWLTQVCSWLVEVGAHPDEIVMALEGTRARFERADGARRRAHK